MAAAKQVSHVKPRCPLLMCILLLLCFLRDTDEKYSTGKDVLQSIRGDKEGGREDCREDAGCWWC
jgi:hypothetical protein